MSEIRKLFQCLCITLHVTLCIAKTQKVEYVKSIEVKSEKEQKISKIYQFEHVVIGKQAAAASVRHYYCCWVGIRVSEFTKQNKTKCFGYPCGSIFKADLLLFMCVTFYVVFI